MAGVILAPGAGFSLELAQGALEIGQAVAAGIIPCRGDQVAGGKQRLDGRGLPAGQAVLIVAEAPASIEGAAKDARAVAGQHRLIAQLRGHGIDLRRPVQQAPWRDRAAAECLAGAQVVCGEMARPEPGRGFGMAADDKALARVLVPRRRQHVQKFRAPGAQQRRIAPRLVDHQHIAGRGRRGIGQMGVVFGKVGRDQPVDGRPCLRLAGLGIRRGHKAFNQRRRFGVEMQPQWIKDQPDRPASRHRPAPRPSRQDRAQECVLDPQQPRAAPRGKRGAPPCGRTCAPDPDQIPRTGQAQRDPVSRQPEDAAEARPGQKPAVENEKPPGGPGGFCFIAHRVSGRRSRPSRHPSPCRGSSS